MNTKTTKTERQEMAAKLGSRGGRALIKKYGKKHMSKISKLGTKARWPNASSLVEGK